jgi:hypothetical protein
VAGSDDAEGWRAASRRRRGFAQRCGRRPSFDSGARTHARYTSRGAAAGFPASPSAMCEHPEIDLAPLKPPSCSAAIVLQ